MKFLTAFALVFVVSFAAPAFADIDWDEKELTEEELIKRGFAGGVELGFNMTTGNTETTTYRSKIDVDHFLIGWRNNYVFETDYKEDDDEVKEERYFASAQGNRQWAFAINSYTFYRYSYENDRFNGMEDANTISVGYGQRVLETDSMFLDLEGGPGYRTNDAKDKNDEMIARVAGNYSWDISETSKFTQRLSSEIGEDNVVTRSETAITASIIGSLAMKASFTVTHQTAPTVDEEDDEELSKTDTRTAVTLLYSF
ncbi:YdiY family protein [Corallincola platygyrae]|uniref:YdiY family protein n=1 Tax=Corallincola platygyrae TaxID=1193278 RepID=A0ABW4XNF9_9GAMM